MPSTSSSSSSSNESVDLSLESESSSALASDPCSVAPRDRPADVALALLLASRNAVHAGISKHRSGTKPARYDGVSAGSPSARPGPEDDAPGSDGDPAPERWMPLPLLPAGPPPLLPLLLLLLLLLLQQRPSRKRLAERAVGQWGVPLATRSAAEGAMVRKRLGRCAGACGRCRRLGAPKGLAQRFHRLISTESETRSRQVVVRR
mmetsp:Transcript_2971/g.12160  ORF Transcript_2971/g.12160 Transcript_2971/m.12160 type:complete len:205 (+) Transcript_2971:92-706(+)